MALRFESLNKISRFMTFLERILVMPMHMFLTAVCLGKVRYVRYVQYDCNFRTLHPCNMSCIPAYCRIWACSSLQYQYLLADINGHSPVLINFLSVLMHQLKNHSLVLDGYPKKHQAIADSNGRLVMRLQSMGVLSQ